MWDSASRGVVRLPSGRLVRGRPIGETPAPSEAPDFGLYLLGGLPPAVSWSSRWVRWRDWRLPADLEDARDAIYEAWARAAYERVEVACRGGRGRTGTLIACVAVLDGVPAPEAVGWVRRHYHPRAVETPGQRRYVARFVP